jgi:hypothetical protein
MAEKQIEETKVNYQIALLAKELGFNEACYFHFGTDGTEFGSRHPVGVKNTQWVKCVARPTLAHLQQWLIEVCKMVVFVAPVIPDCNEFGFQIYVVDGQVEIDCERFYKTYNEALEKGIEIGLEFIKKRQNNVNN